MSVTTAVLFAASFLASLMEDTAVEFGMSCEEIQRLESNRPDVDQLFHPGGHLTPDSGRVYGQRASGILFHYRCNSERWSASVAVSGLRRDEAIQLLVEAKQHFERDGCAPSLDMHRLSPAQERLVLEENEWRSLKRHPYVVWRTNHRERVITALPTSPDGDEWEASLAVGVPRPHYFTRPEIPVIRCF